MIELSKHIEILLLKHNCVIVPQLGGFVAQDVPAYYVAEERLFLPPHRVVGFNPQLIFNDGTLVQSYMHAYDISYEEALDMLDTTVDRLKGQLQSCGELELNGIGKLYVNASGQYDFEPLGAGILSPSLYGLDAVVVKPKAAAADPAAAAKREEMKAACENKTDKSKHYTLSINKELVNYVAAAVVAVFFYFLWATPLADSTLLNSQEAAMAFPQAVRHLNRPALTKQQEVTAAALAAADSLQRMMAEKVMPETETAEVVRPYTIVLASRVPEKNADRYAGELQAAGLAGAKVVKHKKIVRVVYGDYATEAEAYADMMQLRKSHADFGDAWVLHQPR